jgi:hypothetical protein
MGGGSGGEHSHEEGSGYDDEGPPQRGNRGPGMSEGSQH